jgi:hypothetical protein
MSNLCKDCNNPISWDPKKRQELGTRRPLNVVNGIPDGTIHSCNIGGNGGGTPSAVAKKITPTISDSAVNTTDRIAGGFRDAVIANTTAVNNLAKSIDSMEGSIGVLISAIADLADLVTKQQAAKK